jgi:tetraacyldisaccharide 4'-kinase
MAGVAALRAELYRRRWLDQARLQGPVISVGNLSVGGSGKTPVVLRIAQLLQQAGAPVAILSRGYGGSFSGAFLVVSDGERVTAGPAQAGDEPVMLARALPGVVVAVGPRRDVVGRELEARFGPRVHVLDDGFQHLRLRRDLDVVCLDAFELDDRLLPAGRLREPPSALARADLLLLARADELDPRRGLELRRRLGPERCFTLARRVTGFTSLDGRPRAAPRSAFLLSGIARPERFHADAARQTAVVGSEPHRDHHPFRPADVARAAARAAALGADAIVTTAKDAVRLEPHAAASPLPLLVLNVAAAIEDESAFRERLLGVAGRAA